MQQDKRNQMTGFYGMSVHRPIGLFVVFVTLIVIGVIAYHNGLRARGGADGVGKATTNTVVQGSLAVIISNFFLTNLFLLLL